MTRRFIAFILILTAAVMLLFSGCAEQQSFESSLQDWTTQEEFQEKYVQIMDKLGLLVFEGYDGDSKTVKLDEGVEIFEEDLKLNLHVYELDWEVIDAPTAEEIEPLYSNYNDEVYQRFYKFYRWYRRANGKSMCDYYESGILTALTLYKDENGHNYNNIESWSELTTEDKIEFEAYVQENPDYSETGTSYKKLLHWLGVEK